MEITNENTRFLTRAQFHNLSRAEIYPEFSVLVTIDPSDMRDVRFLMMEENHRTKQCVNFIEDVFVKHGAEYFAANPHAPFTFALEGGDCPRDTPCVSWQKKWFYENVVLLPDFFYTEHDGYIRFLPDEVPEWSSRSNTVLWRGSTTGGWGFTAETLETIPRYRMCRIGQTLGEQTDFKFYHVIQGRSEQDHIEVRARLEELGLWGHRIPLEDFAKHKFFMQIDGNGNSWELVKKLRLGCCMLLVDSDWLLYHNPLLRPWHHYVPVKNDLSDLAEIVAWCQSNDRAAQEIGENGRRFALAIDYEAEMRQTIKSIVEHADARAR